MNRSRAALCVATALLWSAAQAQVGNNENILNPNVAGEDQLEGVTHLDPELVGNIFASRPFSGAAELDGLLSGSLNESELAEVYGQLFVPINLNSAPEDEILLIPGMSKRMAHEFEEYRPYRSLEQFRREIGKYVDDAEVARLEQYVFVPLDLNSASEADFAGIPGVGSRMVHEFLEYRPYRNMEQFRREIGKYVDDGEVARLERYMTID
ncbi:MAG: helix-hairpin-helix domain-containing protein [Gammaproteobacteria bacterium]|nr:helix-hairpin-helix domain-containing protein [Gammaproteobacteria bacterium]